MSNSPNPSGGDDDEPGWWSAAATFFGRLADSSVSLGALAGALVLLMTEPVTFIREHLLSGFLVILVETAIRGFFGLLAQAAAELQLAATQLWDGTVGTLLGVGSSVMGQAIEPAILGVQSALSAGFETLGLAAPFAAALSIAATAILVVLATTVVLEVLRWALPIGALTQPAANTLSGARATLSQRLFGSGGDR
ncbi:hypothetical protein [Natronomonas sp. LN261]|uniref:hypothetical protein n=1 Tax=Natronomonas sp. LN261 TaxID=2750669 RepID=UPI0015EE7B4E|nr:hypothetical protein [Natronomonas sp. LN261]